MFSRVVGGAPKLKGQPDVERLRAVISVQGEGETVVNTPHKTIFLNWEEMS